MAWLLLSNFQMRALGLKKGLRLENHRNFCVRPKSAAFNGSSRYSNSSCSKFTDLKSLNNVTTDDSLSSQKFREIIFWMYVQSFPHPYDKIFSQVAFRFVFQTEYLSIRWMLEKMVTIESDFILHSKTGSCKYYMRWPQVNCSAGNDCLRFSQVNRGNLSAPTGSLRESIIVRVRSSFVEPRNVSFYQYQTIWPK